MKLLSQLDFLADLPPPLFLLGFEGQISKDHPDLTLE
jgi:hypothetical protein